MWVAGRFYSPGKGEGLPRRGGGACYARPVRIPQRAGPAALLVLAFACGAAPAFVLGLVAWPEIVTPAWFVSRGCLLYDAVFFPHTPLLIVSTAGAGALAGFSAVTFRAVAGLSSGLAAVLLAASARPGSARLLAILFGAPLLALQSVYLEGPALWPEPFLAPFPLAATLLLERWERRGRERDLLLGGLVLGAGILVKQTFAWFGLGALLWTAVASRRRSVRAAVRLAASVAAPYAAFVLLWGAAFRTTAHVRWTLVHVVFGSHAGEIAAPPTASLVHEAIAPFLAFPALGLLRAALARRRVRSPLVFLGLAAFGMAWPRWGPLHLAAAQGLLVLAALRGLRLLPVLLRRLSRRGSARRRELLAAAGLSLLLVNVGVAAFGAGPFLLDSVGGPARYWDDETTREWAGRAQARTRPGGLLFVFEAPYETLYPLTGTTTPGGFYVNPAFWYYLNKDGIDGKLVASLRGRRDVPVLFREPPDGPDGDRLRETATYRFLAEETVEREKADSRTGWRGAR